MAWLDLNNALRNSEAALTLAHDIEEKLPDPGVDEDKLGLLRDRARVVPDPEYRRTQRLLDERELYFIVAYLIRRASAFLALLRDIFCRVLMRAFPIVGAVDRLMGLLVLYQQAFCSS
ncbi:MAG: hypothetical protein WCD38_11595 [Candidatus Tumulicola sp.]